MNTFRPGTAGLGATPVELKPTETVEDLKVSGQGLLDMDTFSKSDPFCVLRQQDPMTGQWAEVARTETIDNTLNPEWVRPFRLDYFFEEHQLLQFHVFDSDSKARDLSQHDFLGSLEVSLGEIVANVPLRRPLRGPRPNAGFLTIRAEEESVAKEEVSLLFRGKKLDKKDWFGKSDPFLAFYRSNEDGKWTVVHRTEVIKNTLNPSWKEFTIPVRALCLGDYHRSILIKCIDWNRDGTEDLIGEVTTNLSELTGTTQGPVSFQLLKAKGKKAGQLELLQGRVQKFHSFLDFIGGGTQLNCTIAIDFTASNGNPAQADSLHFMGGGFPNHYVQALSAVGAIVQDYDTDKLFPVLGFGARLPPDGRVSHEFFVNLHPSNPFCSGVDGCVAAYQACLPRIQLYGPTNFAPVINHVARFAAQKRDGSEYFILLIITDGVITDMPQTKDAIVAASNLPLSIIIVGVGNADFTAMEELDGDDDGEFGRLRSSRGVYASRDIVQFVPFRNFVSGKGGGGARVSQARLAKEVLAEIPAQFLSFMKSAGLTPQSLPPRPPAPPTASFPASASSSFSPSVSSSFSPAPSTAPSAPSQPHFGEPPPPYPAN